MKRIFTVLWRFLFAGCATLLVIVAILVLLIFTFRIQRPPAPPAGVEVAMPWGALDSQNMALDAEVGLQASIAESLRSETATEFDRDNDGIREYAVLALSGGGANGSYGAGLLCGWTERGDRPEFKVVTGVSAGALQSIPAFLGTDYDDTLRTIFTEYDTPEVYSERAYSSVLMGYSLYDTAPLKAKIDRHVDADVVKAIATRHRRGYRLFVATTNMDTRELVIWDIGRIAASGRRDAIEHIRRILLASCSIPVVFPPVYFEVEAAGKTYHEMHTDGGLYASVFLRGFMLNLEDAFKDAGIDEKKTEFSVYVVRNGVDHESRKRRVVSPNLLSLATASVQELSDVGTTASFFRVYTLSRAYGVPFLYTAIPSSYDGATDAIRFEREMMKKLYQFGFDRILTDNPWLTQPPGLHVEETDSITFGSGDFRPASN